VVTEFFFPLMLGAYGGLEMLLGSCYWNVWNELRKEVFLGRPDARYRCQPNIETPPEVRDAHG
jgi:hypothetical protein